MAFDPEIRDAVDAIQVIDTHEHQEEESARLGIQVDFFRMFRGYEAADLIVAGMPPESLLKLDDPGVPIDEKWHLFEPHYAAARNTAYLKAARIAIRDLYGIEELNASTYALLTERMQEQNKPGVVRRILRDRCRLRCGQVHALDTAFFRRHTDPEVFQQDLSVSALLEWPSGIAALEQELNVSITTFEAYADAIDKLFAAYAPYADAIKQHSAYLRPQVFADVPDSQAKRVFDSAANDPGSLSVEQKRVMEDWAFHRCIRLSIEHDLPIKIHTGYRAGDNCMYLENLHPGQLSNLFRQYPRASFDVFHIGYPYQDEMVALAKQYTNVYVDMCWTWIIDPQASRQFLKQCLTAVPANKLFAFGGDYVRAELVYGHLRLARDGITRGLSELVDEDYFSRQEAIAIAHRILHDNQAEVFKVDAKQDALRQLQEMRQTN